MADVLHVSKREEMGSSACRRLRNAGSIPAVLYGHGLQNVHLSVPEIEVHAALRHGKKMVEMQGDVSDNALLRDIQWDALGAEILHLDLTRVSAEESVEVEIAIVIRGEAPGTKQGGILEQVTHRLMIRCPAGAIPDHLEIKVNELQLNESISASAIQLPAKSELVSDSETIIVNCIQPIAEPGEEEAAPSEGVEPEVIGRAAEGEEDTES